MMTDGTVWDIIFWTHLFSLFFFSVFFFLFLAVVFSSLCILFTWFILDLGGWVGLFIWVTPFLFSSVLFSILL